MNSLFRYFVFFGIALFTAFSNLTAGNTGKMIGKVTDAGSGEPIPSVNILVVGTSRGAVTDFDGKYTIIGIPIGNCTVRASAVGYQQVDITDVKIGADATTPINFKLTSTAVEVKGVTISADAQMVNNMSTGATTTIGSGSIENIPNVKSVEDVVSLQSGVVKQNGNIFVRGGRANEVQYLVDGIPSNNILGSSSATSADPNADLGRIFSGNASGSLGGSGLSISANSIQSVSVQTSGFDADYGNAQSGVISIQTKSGSPDRYSGSLQYRTDRVSSFNQNENYTSFSVGGPEPISKYVLPGLGVSLPGALTFFFNGDADRADGAFTFAHNQFFHPLERRVVLNGFLGGILNGLGFNYADNQQNAFTFNSKVQYSTKSDQVSYGYRASLSSSHAYSNQWQTRADSSSLNAKLNIQHAASWTHFFSANSFLKVYLGKLESRDGNDVAGLVPSDYPSLPYYSDIGPYLDPNRDGLNDLGSNQTWSKSLTNVWSTRVDFNSQVHPLHFFKAGFEFNYEEINSTRIDYPNSPNKDNVSPPFVVDSTNNRGDFPGYGRNRWVISAYPNRGGAYLQDNIEFSGLNIHFGIRYDYFDVGRQVYDTSSSGFIEQWTEAVKPVGGDQLQPFATDFIDAQGYDGDKLRKGYFLNDSHRFFYYLTHGYASPRLAIGYPVTDRIVFYFNYGHFLQFPDRENYYYDPSSLNSTANTTVGNPGLKPKRTVSYEASFEDQFTDEMAFKVHAFYKDVFDYENSVDRGAFNVYRNFDYSSDRGFELTFGQSLSNLTLNLTYSYQLAKGRTSSPLVSSFFPYVSRETRLDFDQNHTANLFVQYHFNAKEPGKFLWFPFVNNYGISITWNYGSGFPYTPFDPTVIGSLNKSLLNNTETKPATSIVNLSMYKGILLSDRLNLLLTLDVTNLFNRINVDFVNNNNTGSGAPGATPTGQPPRYGDYDYSGNSTEGQKLIYPWRTVVSRLDPRNFQALRQVILGVKLNWE
jgi:outer membrane receptor protein involved in Fe transport